MARTKSASADSSANLGFEAKLWLSAEQAVPAPHLADTEYNGGRPQGLLGLIFLKYISDSSDEHHAKLVAGIRDALRALNHHRTPLVTRNVISTTRHLWRFVLTLCVNTPL